MHAKAVLTEAVGRGFHGRKRETTTSRIAPRAVVGAALFMALAAHAPQSLAEHFWVDNTLHQNVYVRCEGAATVTMGARIERHFNCSGETIEAAPTSDAADDDWQSLSYGCADVAVPVGPVLAGTTKVIARFAAIVHNNLGPFVLRGEQCGALTIQDGTAQPDPVSKGR